MANILMLEPDAILAETYRKAFEHSGHSVRRSVSAQDGVFLVDELLPDVILVEIQLVAHSGIEFMYELRSYAEWQHIPVLIHSSIPPSEFEDSMVLLQNMLNVRAYLYKPHTMLAALLRAVREVTEETLSAKVSVKSTEISEISEITDSSIRVPGQLSTAS